MKVVLLTIIICFGLVTSWSQSKSNVTPEDWKNALSFPVMQYTKLYTYEEALKRTIGQITICGPIPGLTIFSDSVMEVKSCMGGTVKSIFEVDGRMALVAICGDHFLSYYNFDTVFVKKGDILNSQQLIGRVSTTNGDQLFELELALMDKKGRRIDPYPLLKKDHNKTGSSKAMTFP